MMVLMKTASGYKIDGLMQKWSNYVLTIWLCIFLHWAIEMISTLTLLQNKDHVKVSHYKMAKKQMPVIGHVFLVRSYIETPLGDLMFWYFFMKLLTGSLQQYVIS